MIMNTFKTLLTLSLLSSLFAACGYAVGGAFGTLYALIGALIVNGLTYLYGDRMILKVYKAQPLPTTEGFTSLHEMVAELCTEMKLAEPTLYLITSEQPNAFATGRSASHASVAVTTGIIDLLEPDELRAVLAHELSHIQNNDMLIGTIAATLATAIGSLADIIRWTLFWSARGKNNENRGSGTGLFIIAMLTPIIAMILQLSVSRSREYLADECGARTIKDPLALARALRKLQEITVTHATQAPSTAHATAASLFIVYPFFQSGMQSLFSTHPPLQKRIERLEKMS